MSDNSTTDHKPPRAVRDELNSSFREDSKLFKFFSFLSLTDYQVIKECGTYDRTLVYAIVLRQLVTFVFTCLLFSYGVSTFLDLYPAIIVGVVFALTLFFLDQAIVGSDWALKNPFKEGLSIRSLLGLIPRVMYSLILAIGLATLAEISLQADAIDEQIQIDTNEKNQEYFAKLKKYEQELEFAIRIDRKKVNNIQSEIQLLKDSKIKYELASRLNDAETLGNTLSIRQENLTELLSMQQTLILEIASTNQRLTESREDYNYWFNEALLERTGKDGRVPTEGPKYRRAVETYTDLKMQINILEKSLVDASRKLDALKLDINSANTELNKVQIERNEIMLNESRYKNNNLVVEQLDQDLVAATKDLTQAIDEKQRKMDVFRKKLEQDGLFYDVKSGVLRRYLALKKIHADPEVGEAASLFSLMLRIFFIAIELMPVIIKLFFSPFSFYALRMHRKMHIALMEEAELLDSARAECRKAKESRIRETGDLDAI